MSWRWRKLGLVFRPADAGVAWMHSHAQLPVADRVDGGVYRMYFAARNKEQISRVGWVTVELADTVRLIDIGTVPVVEPGPPGTFDEHGVFPSCVVDLPDRKRMYYIGWNRGYRAPMFYASIGLAESLDGGVTWHKVSAAPIMGRSEHDPCLVTSPHVMWHGDRFRMTYVSGTHWSEEQGVLQSHYHIKYAESTDGVAWHREGRVAIDYANQDETNVARSWVIEESGVLRMFFGYVRRGSSYRIGYAESRDWLRWARDDGAAGLSPSASSFDSEMQCYPNIVQRNGHVFMFYNGNRFGAEGFGAAVCERA